MSTASIWRNRDFVWLFTGRTLSQLGTAVTTFTIPWLLLHLTGSAAQAGIAFAVGFVPYLLLSLPAGVWADQHDRRKMMMSADAGRLLLILSIPLAHLFAGEIPVVLLFAVQAGVSLLSALFDAAYGACLPNIIGRTQLQEGNAALQMGSSLSRIGGPVAAGLLISMLGEVNVLLVDAASYVVAMATLLLIRTPFTTSDAKAVRTGMLADVREALRFVLQNRTLRSLALFSMLVNLVGPGMDLALLYRIKDELHLPSDWAGLIMAGLSGGMLAGSLVIGRLKKRFSMSFLLTASSIGLILPPFLLTAFAHPAVMLLAQVLVGFLLVAWNVQTITLRQTVVPDRLQGRCVSLFRLIAWVTIPLGAAGAGLVSEGWGAHAFFLMAGCVHLVVALLCLNIRPHEKESLAV